MYWLENPRGGKFIIISTIFRPFFFAIFISTMIMIINLMMIVIQIGADEGGGSTKFLSLFYSTAGPCLTCQRCGDEYDDHHGHREYADHDDHHGHREYADHYDHCGHRDRDLASMHWCNDGFTVLQGLSSWMSSLAEKKTMLIYHDANNDDQNWS